MKYPQFLKENDLIGTTALSDGIGDILKQRRLDHAHEKLKEEGFSLIESESVRKSIKGRSAKASKRAEEFMKFIEDPKVNAIILSSGGDFLLETLPFINFEKLEENIKWIQGFSDPTGILFAITTKLDIATIYSHNVSAFGMEPWHSSLKENIQILKGQEIIQQSFSLYEKERAEEITGLEDYHLDTTVIWKNLFSNDIHMEGRMIGGCLDLLSEIAGTPYENVLNFIDKYKDDGIIWFFDNCELSNEDLIRTFWKLEACGWFQYCKGILLGRSATDTSYYNISFEETLKDALKHLQIPIIYDMDFGHIPPRMTFINGGYAKIHSKDGKGTIQFLYK